MVSPFRWTVDENTRVELKPGLFKRRVLVNGEEVLKQAFSPKQPLQFKLGSRSATLTMAQGYGFQQDVELRVSGEVHLSERERTQRACLACGQKAKAEDQFCERCGAALPEAATQRKIIRLNSARGTIAGVGWLFLVAALFMGFLQSEIAKESLKNLEGYAATDVYPEPIDGETLTVGQLREQVQREPYQVAGLNVFLALVMFGLYYYSRRAPLTALIAAVSVYVAVQVLNAIVDPKTLAQGIYVKIFVTFFLANGVRSALQLRNLKA